jgi:hypothetical protein
LKKHLKGCLPEKSLLNTKQSRFVFVNAGGRKHLKYESAEDFFQNSGDFCFFWSLKRRIHKSKVII